jgi:hypothetical protein
MRDDLETFNPTPRTLVTAGQTFAVLPLRIRQYSAFVRAIQPALPLLYEGNVLGACAQEADAMIGAVAIACNVPVADIDALFVNDFTRLAEIVVEVNGDFFLAHVLPVVRELVKNMSGKIAAGISSLPGLESADTASTTASI